MPPASYREQVANCISPEQRTALHIRVHILVAPNARPVDNRAQPLVHAAQRGRRSDNEALRRRPHHHTHQVVIQVVKEARKRPDRVRWREDHLAAVVGLHQVRRACALRKSGEVVDDGRRRPPPPTKLPSSLPWTSTRVPAGSGVPWISVVFAAFDIVNSKFDGAARAPGRCSQLKGARSDLPRALGRCSRGLHHRPRPRRQRAAAGAVLKKCKEKLASSSRPRRRRRSRCV